MKLPPVPPGALGWNVYSGPWEDGYHFVQFVADEDAVGKAGARRVRVWRRVTLARRRVRREDSGGV